MKKAFAALALLTIASVAQAQQPTSLDVSRPSPRAGKTGTRPIAMKIAAVRACSPKGSASYGIPISGTLGTAGSCTNVDSTGTSYSDFYQFNATFGHTIQVTSSSNLDYTAAVLDDSGQNAFGTSQDCGFTQNECSFTVVVPETGTYWMGIGAYDTGDYTLQLDDVTTGGPATCVATSTNLCLNSGRFQVAVAYSSSAGSGAGTAIALTPDTGYFWFFSSGNVEMVIKVVDGRSFNNHFWVFAGGLTNVDVTITVTDTQTSVVKTYHNPQNTAFQPIQDTAAF
jgi:hypothetical protein